MGKTYISDLCIDPTYPVGILGVDLRQTVCQRQRVVKRVAPACTFTPGRNSCPCLTFMSRITDKKTEPKIYLLPIIDHTPTFLKHACEKTVPRSGDPHHQTN